MSKINQYNESFQKELARLNEHQRQAVEHIEGPVLVVAGPGTGKTHILTARIGQILQQTDTQAHNILCLTFTDSGVHAMRQRLLEFIGPEAHRVHIYTFHSFCNKIIQDNLELFGRHDLEPLSDLERVEIIRRIIDELEIDHPLKRGRSDIYFYETHLFNLFRRMKSENWSVDYIKKQTELYLNDLPNRAEFIYKVSRGDFKKGEPKQAKLDATKEKMTKLQAAASLYPRYLHYMKDLRRYDYDDMILWVLDAFKKHPYLLRSYQEQYLYFLIDEYQDTNGAQNEILQNLVAYWQNPNVFIVGDDDQSIYEFQGARLKNLTDFYEKYDKDLELVLLKDNYRSSQHILDASNALILNNSIRLVNSLKGRNLVKDLKAQHPFFAHSKVTPQITEYKNRTQENTDIVAQIEQLQKDGKELNEIAIIYAQHRQADEIIRLLEKKQIPYNTRRRINILNEPIIQNLRTLLTYINLEYNQAGSGEYLLFQILHFPFLNIDPKDIMTLSLFQAKQNFVIKKTWRELIGNEEVLDSLDLKNKKALLDFSNLINQWTIDYVTYTLPRLVENIFNKSGLLNYALHHEQKLWQLQVLHTFLNFARQESERRPRLNINRFLEILKNMDANRLSVELYRSIVHKNGVNLLTGHSAKGLEFESVFIIDTVSDYWEPRSSSRNNFSLPDTITFSGEEDAMEARRRLFYVAMTRAKEQLHLSYSAANHKEKPLQRCAYIDEIISATDIEVQAKSLSTESLLEAQLLLLQAQEIPEIEAPDTATIKHLLEGFVMSVSSLNTYLRCPLSFYYEYVLRVPSLNSPAAAYGTAMHHALRIVFEKMKASEEKIFPSAKATIRYFEKEMERQQQYFTPKEYQFRLTKGRSYLVKYYDQYIETWPQTVEIEYELRNVEVEGVPIKGVIDRLDILDEQYAHIEDYKTGKTDKKKLARPTDSKPLGGNYWRQLVFYKILYEASSATRHIIKTGAISYLETNDKGKFDTVSIKLSPNDVQTVKGFITESWAKIQAHEFNVGCGEPKCMWCNFVKDNTLPKSLADKEVEELDD